MPIERKPAKISNQQFLNALLYMVENGCKWRASPKKYGNWHTIYMKFNRWAKNAPFSGFLKNFKVKILSMFRAKFCA